MEHKYRLIGTFQVSEEKRTELNALVLRLLEVSGIRKVERMMLGNKMIKVVSVPVPDEKGIVTFNYSIFEQKERNITRYDMNTGKLDFDNPGLQEYGLTMNLIMLLQEMYSDTPCYLVNGVESFNIDRYADLLGTLLDMVPLFEHRSKIWDMYLRVRSMEEFKDIVDYNWINKMGSFDYSDRDVYLEHLRTMNTFEKEGGMELKPGFNGIKEEIVEFAYSKVCYYIYMEIKKRIEAGETEVVKEIIKALLKASLEERKKMAGQDGWPGIVAELSVHALPPFIVWPFAIATGTGFWEAWEKLGGKGYTDIEIMEIFGDWRIKGNKVKYPMSLYKAFYRDNQDEFLEFWSKNSLILSKEMNDRIEVWKTGIPKTKVPDSFNMERVLGQILYTMEYDWGCRYVDKRFIEECLEHKDDENYRKMIQYYLELVKEPLKYFPELTREQAVNWIIRRHSCKVNRDVLSGYQSLFINHIHRYEIFGF